MMTELIKKAIALYIEGKFEEGNVLFMEAMEEGFMARVWTVTSDGQSFATGGQTTFQKNILLENNVRLQMLKMEEKYWDEVGEDMPTEVREKRRLNEKEITLDIAQSRVCYSPQLTAEENNKLLVIAEPLLGTEFIVYHFWETKEWLDKAFMPPMLGYISKKLGEKEDRFLLALQKSIEERLLSLEV